MPAMRRAAALTAAASLVGCGASHFDDLARVGLHHGDAALAKARSPETVLKLHLMKDKGLKTKGAVCLDGSDAGFYFAPASEPAHAKDWQIYFEGGGWCYDEMDCWGRSSVSTGTTKDRPATQGGSGLISDDCKINPDFCNFNRVYMIYCDGNSFSGNREEPLVVTGLDGKKKPLYFRGRRIMDAVLETLMTMGLDKAENVMLTGCSAGGLATYLHTDYVYSWLQAAKIPMKKFGSVPVSGVFLLHNNVEGKPVYPEEMKTIFELANSTHGLNDRCIADMSEQDRWRCNFAEVSYRYIQAPIFSFNSALDQWSTGCILTSELDAGYPNQKDTANGRCAAAPGWAACSNDPEGCSAVQVGSLNSWINDFQRALNGSVTYTKAGNGAFIHSCHTHCEAQDDHWFNTFAVNGVTMQQALSKWWHSDGSESAQQHTYHPCTYHAEASTKRCNPTCAPFANLLVV